MFYKTFQALNELSRVYKVVQNLENDEQSEPQADEGEEDIEKIDENQIYSDFELATLRTKVKAHKNREGAFPEDLDEL